MQQDPFHQRLLIFLMFQGMQDQCLLFCLTPGIRLSGATKNELTLTLPESVAMAGSAGTTNRVVLYVRGFLEQNGAQFNPAAARR